MFLTQKKKRERNISVMLAIGLAAATLALAPSAPTFTRREAAGLAGAPPVAAGLYGWPYGCPAVGRPSYGGLAAECVAE